MHFPSVTPFGGMWYYYRKRVDVCSDGIQSHRLQFFYRIYSYLQRKHEEVYNV
jgi:hypothetical protein